MPTELDAVFHQFKCGPRPSNDLASLDRRPLFIYGAGNTGKATYRILTAAGFVVSGFFDAAAVPGASWEGLPIFHPDDVSVSAAARKTCHVIVCVFNAFAEVAPILSSLHQRGFESLTTFFDFHALFAFQLGDHYWLTSRSLYDNAQRECEAVYDLLSDTASRELFVAMLRLRLLGDCERLPQPDTRDQYFPADLPPYRQPLRFVDCGAYRGDCLEQILARDLKLAAVAGFEPDDANFVKLSQFVATRRDALPKDIYLFPCGVDSTTRKVRFSSGQGVASRVDSTGDTLIQCAAIDEALPGFSPNFIKMDVEGAELSALWGARRTILEHRPALAISLYHTAAHLWQLPLLAASWYGNGAKYYLRSHGCNGFELVFYVRA